MFRFGAVLTLSVWACAADYDILIRNSRVVDGTGNPWFRADVAVRDGKIVAIAKLLKGSAYREIDAKGRILAPGFIDVHTHIETGIEKVPRGDNYLFDGVTTVVTGNCGGSKIAIGEWFSQLEKSGIGVNVASLIGHNSVRREVMGMSNRSATPEEITQMQAIVEKAMREGAIGFSTGLIYIPGTYSNSEEVIALAQAAAVHGGVYASHMRDEGSKIIEAIDEAVAVGKATGMPVQLSHFKIDNKNLWGESTKTLARIEQYRREGIDVVVDQYPYERSSTNLGITLPSWSLADGEDRVRERLSDPETKQRIVTEMEAMLASLGRSDYSHATVANFEPNRAYEGKTISEVNLLEGRSGTVASEIETILGIMQQGRAQMVYHSMGAEDVERIMKYPNTAIASDGGVLEFGVGVPHPRSYGTHARVLGEYVRNRGLLTLEDAIRRMTSLPARTFRMRNRGLVREGFVADLLLFDPSRVVDKATFSQPHQYSEGFDFVFVNGAPVIDEGAVADLRPGKIVRP